MNVSHDNILNETVWEVYWVFPKNVTCKNSGFSKLKVVNISKHRNFFQVGTYHLSILKIDTSTETLFMKSMSVRLWKLFILIWTETVQLSFPMFQLRVTSPHDWQARWETFEAILRSHLLMLATLRARNLIHVTFFRKPNIAHFYALFTV